MTSVSLDELCSALTRCEQHALVAHLRSLQQDQQASLIEQLGSIDLDLFGRQLEKLSTLETASTSTAGTAASRAVSPANVVRLPRNADEIRLREQAAVRGQQLLEAGRVGAIVVAGGQGSRLGFEHPKGMFPIGPVTTRSLFQLLCEQLLARSRAAGVAIPYFIMTSRVTHQSTVEFFTANDFFGLSPADVHFFQQGNMPAVDRLSRQILLGSSDTVQLSPDGHGGLLQALQRANLFDVMRHRGIDTLYYHQVDNPTAIVCDPVFLGLHQEYGSQISTKVVAKTSPQEKMGVVVDIDGQTQIIEYSDLPAEQSDRRDDSGEPVFWAGNTAIHAFDRDFLEELACSETSLPFHLARKNVPCLDETGQLHSPDDPANPNAIKFERFIFDALPFAQTTLVVEAERALEFNPVKNATGNDSPQTSRQALQNLYRNWLVAAGHQVPAGLEVEISPLIALSADGLDAVQLPQLHEASRLLIDPQGASVIAPDRNEA